MGMRETLVESFGEEGGVAKEVVDWDEPELRRERERESDGPAPGVGDIAGEAWLWGKRCCGEVWWIRRGRLVVEIKRGWDGRARLEAAAAVSHVCVLLLRRCSGHASVSDRPVGWVGGAGGR